jgi:hypothetical protein
MEQGPYGGHRSGVEMGNRATRNYLLELALEAQNEAAVIRRSDGGLARLSEIRWERDAPTARIFRCQWTDIDTDHQVVWAGPVTAAVPLDLTWVTFDGE